MIRKFLSFINIQKNGHFFFANAKKNMNDKEIFFQKIQLRKFCLFYLLYMSLAKKSKISKQIKEQTKNFMHKIQNEFSKSTEIEVDFFIKALKTLQKN